MSPQPTNMFVIGAIDFVQDPKTGAWRDKTTIKLEQSRRQARRAKAKVGAVLGAFAVAAVGFAMQSDKVKAMLTPAPEAQVQSYSVMTPSNDGKSFITTERYVDPSLPMPAREMKKQNQNRRPQQRNAL